VPGRCAWALAAASCAVFGVFALTYPLNHDVGSYLHIARVMLEGETLYTTFIEVNPPLYAYLAMLPVQLAAGLDLSAVRLMQISILTVSLAAVAWSGVLAGAGDGDSRLRGPLAALALGLPVLGLAGVDFGQREHLMVVLTAPYLVLAARRGLGRPAGRAAALAAGLLAGVGFSLKPHFVVLWLAIELVLLVRSKAGLRSVLRAETIAVVGFFVAYAGFVLLVHPEYLPLLWKAGPLYADYLSVDRLRLFGNRYSVLLGATVFAVLVYVPSRAAKPLVSVLLLAAGLAFLMAVGQGKGWLYHFYPALAWTVAAAVLLVADYFASAWRSADRMSAGRVLVIVLLLTVGALATGSLVVHHRVLADARREYVAEQSRYFSEHGVRSIAILSPSLPAAFPLVNYTGVEWAAPFPSLWWVAAAHENDSPAEGPAAVPMPRSAIEAEFLELMASGVASRPPDIVLVDTTRIERLGGRPFPYPEYLSQHAGFASMWSRYESRGTLGPFDLYRRTSPEGAEPRR
jgi:hypothetical protein